MSQLLIFCEADEDKHALPTHLAGNNIDCSTPGDRLDFDFLSPDIIVPVANVSITLLNVILMYIQKRKERKIIIKGMDGWKIEVPDNSSQEQLEKYIEMATENEAKKIVISRK
jgi:hypothetical protein